MKEYYTKIFRDFHKKSVFSISCEKQKTWQQQPTFLRGTWQ